MDRLDDLERLLIGGQDLSRVAAHLTRNDAPAAQWRALRALRDEGPQRIGALAATCRTTQPGMTRLIGQLDDTGLVARTHDPADSRATVVSVTDAGIHALAAWRAQMRDALEPLFSNASAQDWAAISRVADLLAARTPTRTETTR